LFLEAAPLELTDIDLFCGAGGVSLGLERGSFAAVFLVRCMEANGVKTIHHEIS
jgi:site-specific DNA-cytosine methylase